MPGTPFMSRTSGSSCVSMGCPNSWAMSLLRRPVVRSGLNAMTFRPEVSNVAAEQEDA
jgi:hypothetical protein